LQCECPLMTQSGHWLVSRPTPFRVLPSVDMMPCPEPRGRQ
jgi:hypothetical protein